MVSTPTQHTPLPPAGFTLQAEYGPAGDQPQAIALLTQGLDAGLRSQTLLGVTGSGKTFTMANVIQHQQRPTLILAHNKTLAAQLYNEMKAFFPDNKVGYFISYYDFYQPEAYIPRTDTFIEKSASINDEIDRLRHFATRALFERRDVIIVASVSCIYGLGIPENYLKASLLFEVGDHINRNRDQLLSALVRMQYQRSEGVELKRTHFRLRGDVIDIHPADEERLLRLTFWDDELESIHLVSPETGEILEMPDSYLLIPAVHFVTPEEDRERVLKDLERELEDRLQELYAMGLELEARRLETRTLRDIEMIREVGYCNGIENYSRVLEGRPPGSPPKTLLDYFPEDFLLIIDESHITVPQIRGMYHGDVSRKDTLIRYGFRLPCARDNRPLNFEEFGDRVGQHLFVSATPGSYELNQSAQVAEQIIRPTGLLDPLIDIFPTANQVDTLLHHIQETLAKEERVLITTLTKRMAEDLTAFLQDHGINVRYLHSDIKPLERIMILRDLRLGTFDVLVGVNLLREGLDLPEVSLVAVMDADKEGFLRSESSLIQTIGRAARNAAGRVMLFADRITDSMARAMEETRRRRARQEAFNTEHGITPKTIRKPLNNGLLDLISLPAEDDAPGKGASLVATAPTEAAFLEALLHDAQRGNLSKDMLHEAIAQVEGAMKEAAAALAFERAAKLRDTLLSLQKLT